MKKQKPLLSISLDLDNQWSYMKIHGDKNWENFPSYLDIFVPHVLKVLDEMDLKITFFIVGQDAALKQNHEAIKEIVKSGHEVGNHSFNHESWLHLYPREKVEQEIIKTEEYIEKVTGQLPIGFRGPGFSWNNDLLEILSERGYLFDASTLPTFIGPLARAYYFWTSNLTNEEKKERKGLFGSFKDGFRPVKPYLWELKTGKRLLEIPVSTIPFFKVPYHLSYLLYLYGYSPGMARFYLETAIRMTKSTGVSPSFLLHPLDLIGGDQVKELAFFPGMNIPSQKKVDVFKEMINRIKKDYNVVNMSTHANEIMTGIQEKQMISKLIPNK